MPKNSNSKPIEVAHNGKQTARLSGATKDNTQQKAQKAQKGRTGRSASQQTAVKVVFTFHSTGYWCFPFPFFHFHFQRLANSEKDVTAAIKRQDICQRKTNDGSSK